jgi:hypothetical protein
MFGIPRDEAGTPTMGQNAESEADQNGNAATV